MKVLRLIGGLDATFGGPSVSSVNAAIATARQGVETRFAFPAADPDATSGWPAVIRLRTAGIAVDIAPLARPGTGLARRYGYSPALARLIDKAAPEVDLIHAHSAWVHPSLVALSAGRRHAVPVVLTPHESLTRFDIAQTRSVLLRAAKRRLRDRYESRLAAIVYSSHLEARDSTVAGSRARAVALPHPVYDETRVTPMPRPQRGGPFTLGFLGRLHPKKNVGRLIEALACLPADTRLEIAGSGTAEFEAELRAGAARLGVANRIGWRGFIGDADKPAFFAAIDLLAMPSDYECFGMVAAEAMIAGLPVLVSPETGVAEIVRPDVAGLIVAPEPAAIADAIAPLVGDRSACAALAERGAQAAENFSFARHGARVAALYNDLLATRSPT